jgi:Ran GTPase-activating protein (RanGAP) involved in mRNA processing and transport
MGDHIVRLEDEGSNLRNLNLNIRRLTPEMILKLSQAVKSNRRIEVINMTSSLSSSTQNHNSTTAMLSPLALAIESHFSLTTLHLSYNRLHDASVLAYSLAKNQSSLLELNLDHNALDTQTAFAMAKMLHTNTRLRTLQLNSNPLQDEGGAAIATALRHNTSLQSLGMARTGVASATVSSFIQTLGTNVTLTDLRLERNEPCLPTKISHHCLYIVQANNSGRYLLRDHKQNKKNDSNEDTSDYNNRGLWPLVLKGLEPSMIYFFLREKPSLVPSVTSSSTDSTYR